MKQNHSLSQRMSCIIHIRKISKRWKGLYARYKLSSFENNQFSFKPGIKLFRDHDLSVEIN